VTIKKRKFCFAADRRKIASIETQLKEFAR